METIQSIKEITFKPKYKPCFGVMEGFEIVTDKQTIRMGIAGDRYCCEQSGYFMSEDDFTQFIGAELISIETVDMCLTVKRIDNLYDGSPIFINFNTTQGTLQFTVYNIHNGFYGHRIILESNQLEINDIL